MITANDVPHRRYGLSVKDQIIFALDKVCYLEGLVAAIAATDQEAVQEALGIIEVEYDELPAVFDMEEALRDGASFPLHQIC